MIRWTDETMQLTSESDEEMVARLTAALDWGLSTVEITDLELDRRAPAIDRTDSALRGTAEDLFRMGFRLDEEDSDLDEGRYWAHQGLTGTADAYDSESLDGRKFLIISSHVNVDKGWSDDLSDDERKLSEDRSRLTIIDVTPSSSEYRYAHVLLVDVDDEGQPTPLKSHVGGLAWRGNVLYIASGTNFFEFNLGYLFDLHQVRGSPKEIDLGALARVAASGIAPVTNTPDTLPKEWGNIVRKPGGRYWAFGYRYALVVQRKFTWKNPAGFANHFATVGIAREGSKRWLVTAPWINESSELDECLLGWWRLNEYGYLADRTGTVSAERVAKAETLNIQGICADEGIVWLCTSRGEGDHTLATFKVMAEGTVVGSIFDWTFDWAKYGEGLTYAPSSDHLWNVTEYPKGSRIIFCIDRSMTRGDLAD